MNSTGALCGRGCGGAQGRGRSRNVCDDHGAMWCSRDSRGVHGADVRAGPARGCVVGPSGGCGPDVGTGVWVR
jgi:hypothetical protein